MFPNEITLQLQLNFNLALMRITNYKRGSEGGPRRTRCRGSLCRTFHIQPPPTQRWISARTQRCLHIHGEQEMSLVDEEELFNQQNCWKGSTHLYHSLTDSAPERGWVAQFIKSGDNDPVETILGISISSHYYCRSGGTTKSKRKSLPRNLRCSS